MVPWTARDHCPWAWRCPYTQAVTPARSSRSTQGPGPAMLVEGGVVPEHIERLGALSEPPAASSAWSSAASSRSWRARVCGGQGGGIGSGRHAERTADDRAAGGDRVAADGQLRRPEQRPDRRGAVPPADRGCPAPGPWCRVGHRSRRGRPGPRDGFPPSTGRRATGPGRRGRPPRATRARSGWRGRASARRSRCGRSGRANDRCRSAIAQTLMIESVQSRESRMHQPSRYRPACSPTNGLVRRSWPMVVTGPWPG